MYYYRVLLRNRIQCNRFRHFVLPICCSSHLLLKKLNVIRRNSKSHASFWVASRLCDFSPGLFPPGKNVEPVQTNRDRCKIVIQHEYPSFVPSVSAGARSVFFHDSLKHRSRTASFVIVERTSKLLFLRVQTRGRDAGDGGDLRWTDHRAKTRAACFRGRQT